MYKLKVIIILMTVIFLSFGLFSYSWGAGEEEILVGNIQDMSAGTAIWGQNDTNGILLAAEEINALGGILGKKIRVITYDTKGDPTEAINAYNRLVDLDKVVAVLGPPTSNVGIPLAPIAERKKVPVIGDFMDERATTHSGGVWNFMFLTEPSCSEQAEIAASYALKELKLSKFAVIYNKANSYSVKMAIPFMAYVIKHGGEILITETYLFGDTEFRAQCTKIKNASPEAVFVPGYVKDNALIAKQLRGIGVDVPIIGNNSWYVPLIELAGPAANNTYFPNNMATDIPRFQDFMKLYEKRFGMEPLIHACMGYDNMNILAKAIKKAGKLDPIAIKDAIEQTDHVGVTGRIKFNPETHRPDRMPLVMLKIENEEFVTLEEYLPPLD